MVLGGKGKLSPGTYEIMGLGRVLWPSRPGLRRLTARGLNECVTMRDPWMWVSTDSVCLCETWVCVFVWVCMCDHLHAVFV